MVRGIIIAAVLMLIAGNNAIAGDLVVNRQSRPPPMQLKPSLTCAGTLITTTDKNTSDKVVRHVSVVVDYSKVGEATVRLSEGDAEQISANINWNGPIDILFSDGTSWEENESIKRSINGDINRIRGTMYAYETLWSEGGPVRIRHWYLQCKEDWNPFVVCQPWGLGICILPHDRRG